MHVNVFQRLIKVKVLEKKLVSSLFNPLYSLTFNTKSGAFYSNP